MKISVVREIADKENRVALTPLGAKKLVDTGNDVFVEMNSGVNSGFSNEEYSNVGAKLVDTEKGWSADLVIKVKEPLREEYKFFRENQIVLTYFHLAGVSKKLTEALVNHKTTAVAYETIEDKFHKLPLLAPMSAIAGNMSVTIGSYYLAKFNNGKGIQLGSIIGKKHGKVVVIGDGIVGSHAANVAYGMGANVFLFTLYEDRFESFREKICPEINCVLSTKENIAKHVKDADLVVGAVLLRGAKAPYIVTEEMVKTMQPASVIVDVSIDQGGCIETAKPTTHSNPVYVKHKIIHYCVTNMPAAYPRTSTIALTTETLPYILKIADRGIDAFKEDEGFAKGVNTHRGYITYKSIAEDLGMINKYKEFQ